MPFFSGVFKELRILHHQHQCHDIDFRNAAAWAVITTNVLVGLTFCLPPSSAQYCTFGEFSVCHTGLIS